MNENAISSVYNQDTFWKPFLQDITDSQTRIIIQSPFLTPARVNYLLEHLGQATERNIAICIFTQEPWINGNIPSNDNSSSGNEERKNKKIQETSTLMKTIRNHGIHVNTRKGIHEKLAVVDDKILWEGSLNILSHSRSKERMRRWNSKDEATRARKLHQLDNCDACKNNYSKLTSKEAENRKNKQPSFLLNQLIFNRTLAKLNQEQLAREAGISQSKLCKLEKGTRKLALTDLENLANALDLKLMLIPKSAVPSVSSIIVNSRDHDITNGE